MDGAAVSWCDGVLWNSSAPVCTLPFTPPRLRDLKPKLAKCQKGISKTLLIKDINGLLIFMFGLEIGQLQL
jgi:hypothetical protein